MDEELIKKISWCTRVVRASGTGDVGIVVDNIGTFYNVIKHERVITQFRDIESFTDYCENILKR